ncbi:hypothetical protein [Butyricicoccus sp.]|uniref:hypothetical protein n=1 Tax=Butyricicoccus sp. TaxID=2049021 RepID=UPI003AAE19FA
MISAMRTAAREAVNAAKKELKIKSHSQVFRDEVGVMTMRGFGAGVLKESREQARIIRNASRYLTGEAQTGAIVTNSSDNRRTYNNNVSNAVIVDAFCLRAAAPADLSTPLQRNLQNDFLLRFLQIFDPNPFHFQQFCAIIFHGQSFSSSGCGLSHFHFT